MKQTLEECAKPDEMRDPVCGWKGCPETYPIFKGIDRMDSLPQSWRVLVVGSGPIWDLLDVVVGGGINTPLCPEHSKELMSMLKRSVVKARELPTGKVKK